MLARLLPSLTWFTLSLGGFGCSLLSLSELSDGAGGEAATTSQGGQVSGGGATLASTSSDTSTTTQTSVTTGPTLNLIFSDEFDDDLSAFTTVGGTWSVASGEARQTAVSATLAYAYANAFTTHVDYVIEARAHQLASSDAGAAFEVCFRVDPNTDSMYFCNWEPTSGEFLVMEMTTSGSSALEIVTIAANDRPSPTAPVIFHLDVEGDQIRCSLATDDGPIPGADINLTSSTVILGSFGMKTYALSAAYDYIRVYTKN